MKKQLLMMAIGVAVFTCAAAQEQPKIYTKAAVTDTLTGIKFSSLPKAQQDSLRKEFADNNIKIEEDALVFFARREKGTTSVLREENGKLLNYSLPKGNLYMVPDREALKKIQPKGPQKIYITN